MTNQYIQEEDDAILKLITVIRLYWTMETAHISMIRKERNIWISQQDMQYLLWDITTRNLMMH